MSKITGWDIEENMLCPIYKNTKPNSSLLDIDELMFYLYDVEVGKNIKLWTEPLNGEFQHDGDSMGQFNWRDTDLRIRKHNNEYNIWRGTANNA